MTETRSEPVRLPLSTDTHGAVLSRRPQLEPRGPELQSLVSLGFGEGLTMQEAQLCVQNN